jgi:hypothetical protein
MNDKSGVYVTGVSYEDYVAMSEEDRMRVAVATLSAVAVTQDAVPLSGGQGLALPGSALRGVLRRILHDFVTKNRSLRNENKVLKDTVRQLRVKGTDRPRRRA